MSSKNLDSGSESDCETTALTQAASSDEETSPDQSKNLLGNISKDDDVDDDDDDDDAPDDVAFSTSKDQILSRVQKAIGQIRDEKETAKLKRTNRQNKYIDQKKAKLASLEASRLPDDFLKSIESKPIEKSKSTRVQKENKETAGKESDPESDGDEEDLLQFSDDNLDDDEELISLTSTKKGGIEVKTLKDIERAPKTSAQKAAEFRNQELYKNIKRQPVKNLMLEKAKRRAART